MLANQLHASTSPYLQAHRHNPVHWQIWGPAALALARLLDRPILLSSGYAACHWCHVMARESFEDPAIAAVINAAVIPIKLDREERPDIDGLYQAALEIMGVRRGWPLTILLTPEGAPLSGGTYFPPAPRWGQIGFVAWLEAQTARYRDNPTAQRQAAALLQARLAESPPPPRNPSSDEPGPAALDAAADAVLRQMDPRAGGLRGAPKFPNIPILELLWRGYDRTGRVAWRDAVLFALTRMSLGGLYDHLEGGYARYCTDPAWVVPHFEKMLYDNAQLIALLAGAWRETGQALFRDRLEATIGWLLKRLRLPGGGFAASLAAETDGIEGLYYVWTHQELARVLGPDLPRFQQFFDLPAGGHWQGQVILNRRDPGDAPDSAVLANCLARLAEARQNRRAPARDDKRLADWNGLAISALVQAADSLNRPDWLDAAAAAYADIRTLLYDREQGLRHSEESRGFLADYAAFGRAALALYTATDDGDYLHDAEQVATDILAHFQAPGGAFYQTDDRAPDVILRLIPIEDTATPSGNALALGLFSDLAGLSTQIIFRAAGDALIQALAPLALADPLPYAGFLNALDAWLRPLAITLLSRPGAHEGDELAKIITAQHRPNLLMVRRCVGIDPPIPGKSLAPGIQAAAFICAGPRCDLPISDPDRLRQRLQGLRGG